MKPFWVEFEYRSLRTLGWHHTSSIEMFFFFIVFTMYFNCTGFGRNTVYPWNSKSLHPLLHRRRADNGWLSFFRWTPPLRWTPGTRTPGTRTQNRTCTTVWASDTWFVFDSFPPVLRQLPAPLRHVNTKPGAGATPPVVRLWMNPSVWWIWLASSDSWEEFRQLELTLATRC